MATPVLLSVSPRHCLAWKCLQRDRGWGGYKHCQSEPHLQLPPPKWQSCHIQVPERKVVWIRESRDWPEWPRSSLALKNPRSTSDSWSRISGRENIRSRISWREAPLLPESCLGGTKEQYSDHLFRAELIHQSSPSCSMISCVSQPSKDELEFLRSQNKGLFFCHKESSPFSKC